MAADPRARRPTRAELAAAMSRYRGLIEEWEPFLEALATSPAPSIWANPQRVTPEELAALLAAEGVIAEPISWSPGAFRLRGCRGPGRLWPYLAGLYQVQEEASMAPVRLLEPAPGDRVLDLCAAPGNKTAQIATALGGRGTVIANDRSGGRLAAMQNTICRLGLTNVSVTRQNGCAVPAAAGRFDRVLVDAPCSAEGIRRGTAGAAPVAEEFRRHAAGVQRALLRRALALTRAGGRVVYSTCTFAPEENELVVDDVLSAHPGVARIVAAEIPGLAGAPGLDAWQGRRLSPEIRGCLRLWPHRSGTGGFFVAVLERTGASLEASGGEPVRRPRERERGPALAHPAARAALARYRLPEETLAGFDLSRRGRYLRLIASDHRLPDWIEPVAAGLPAFPSRVHHPRFATAAALAFGAGAGAHTVDLDPDDAGRFLSGRSVRMREPAGSRAGGYLIVRRAGRFALGNGFMTQEDGPVLESRYPRGWIRGA